MYHELTQTWQHTDFWPIAVARNWRVKGQNPITWLSTRVVWVRSRLWWNLAGRGFIEIHIWSLITSWCARNNVNEAWDREFQEQTDVMTAIGGSPKILWYNSGEHLLTSAENLNECTKTFYKFPTENLSLNTNFINGTYRHCCGQSKPPLVTNSIIHCKQNEGSEKCRPVNVTEIGFPSYCAITSHYVSLKTRQIWGIW